MSAYLNAWHGCLEHGANHCPTCKTCSHHTHTNEGNPTP